MAYQDWWTLVVVGPTGKHFPPRDVHGDIDRPDDFRAPLIQIARTDSYLTTGSPTDWIADFEARLFTESEARKGTGDGEWGTPEKTLRFADAY